MNSARCGIYKAKILKHRILAIGFCSIKFHFGKKFKLAEFCSVKFHSLRNFKICAILPAVKFHRLKFYFGAEFCVT